MLHRYVQHVIGALQMHWMIMDDDERTFTKVLTTEVLTEKE